MPATLVGQTNLAIDADFRKRVRAACVKQTITVVASDASAPDRAEKMAACRYFLGQPDHVTERVATLLAGLAGVPDTNAAVTDTQIQTAVETHWLTLARLFSGTV